MKIHEYQAKEIFERVGIPVPTGKIATSLDEAEALAREFARAVVVKAQVHVGGRGKAGGVKLAKNPAEAREKAEKILGMNLKGERVHKVLIQEVLDIAQETYVGIVIDRTERRPVVMVSAAGGVDIEEVARTTPEKIYSQPVDPPLGLFAFQARRLAKKLFSEPAQVAQTAKILQKLYQVFVDLDCSLAEINPLITTPQGEVVALDAKINFDDNGLFRHPSLLALRDPEAEEPAECEAREAGLSFIKLDGKIGCVVNGAGLAMATLDVIQHFGGEPANFLDIGGGAKAEKVEKALRIILSDANVQVILFNIFGGITRCDEVAKGVTEALSHLKIKQPIVFRLTGTNEEAGQKILMAQGLTVEKTMKEVCQKAVSLVK